MWKKYQVLIFMNSHDRCRGNVSEQSENEKGLKDYKFICQKLGKLWYSHCILQQLGGFFSAWNFTLKAAF